MQETPVSHSTPLDRFAPGAAAAERMLKQLANRNRLMVLCALSEGEKSVAELNALIPLSQSALSQHLARLREEQLVQVRSEGRVNHYRLCDPRAARLLATLHQLFCEEETP